MAADVPQEGWYRDPADPARRRWWDGHEWSDIVAPAVVNPGAAAPARPVMADGTTLPYASDSSTGAAKQGDDPDDDAPSRKPSRVRVLQMLVALVAIVATAAVVFVDRGGDSDAPADVPVTTIAPSTTDAPPTTTEALPDEPPTTEPPPTAPADEPVDEVEAPGYRDAYDACRAILDGSSIGRDGLDYQTFRDIDAAVVGPVTELRFTATDAAGTTEAYLCRTLFDGDGRVMVGRLYLDLQNVLRGG